MMVFKEVQLACSMRLPNSIADGDTSEVLIKWSPGGGSYLGGLGRLRLHHIK